MVKKKTINYPTITQLYCYYTDVNSFSHEYILRKIRWSIET